MYIWWTLGRFPTYVRALLFKCLQNATLKLASVCSRWAIQITRVLCMLFSTDWHSFEVTHTLQIAVRPCSVSFATCMLSTSSASLSLRYSVLLSSHRLLGSLIYLFHILVPTYVKFNTNFFCSALYLLTIAPTCFGPKCWPSSGSQSVSLAHAAYASTWHTVGILRMIRIVVMEIKCYVMFLTISIVVKIRRNIILTCCWCYLLCPEMYVSVFRQMHFNHSTDFRDFNI